MDCICERRRRTQCRPEDPLPDQPWSYSPTRLVSKAKVLDAREPDVLRPFQGPNSEDDEGYVWTAGGQCGSKGGVLRRLRPSGTGPPPGRVPEGDPRFVREDRPEPKDPDLGLRWSSRTDCRRAEAWIGRPRTGAELTARLKFLVVFMS